MDGPPGIDYRCPRRRCEFFPRGIRSGVLILCPMTTPLSAERRTGEKMPVSYGESGISISADTVPVAAEATMNDNEQADEVAQLVGKALGGDHDAWNQIVDRFSGRIWAICRMHGLGQADAADVFQQTWLRALENLGSLRSPDRLGAWLGTTCRNEARAALRRAKRTQPTEDSWVLDRETGPDDDPERPLLIADRDAELWEAFNRLGSRCRQVLRVLVVDAEDRRPSYEMAAASLEIPIGSLGPTRKRCLVQLRKFLTEGIDGQVG
jgi:RNA polymerase sigma factor (sigma-70 family)